ncbi:GLPGLI family protein [Polaribacter aestuariivivens]|uniref:GLPGLI family protein n=1 Tax=Polaribacter aestuariivivens TaxID=2304626 RepID=A0A5S3NAU5_9FLAO|nr:GLPGLI family protein [Polaribacter aestuariivivens]TMM32345.1 GLPGLI family protein [Polaribacter aestuariivivens]
MKAIFTTFVLFFVFTVNAQNFQGKAIYKTSQKSNFEIDDDKAVDDKMQEEIRKRLEKMNQKTYILNFDKNVSTYKEDVKLNAPKPQVGGAGIKVFSLGGSGASDIYFKNLKKNSYLNQTEIQGKRFLIKDKLPKYEWELSSETKNIGTYTCYKATFSKEVERKNITVKNGEPVEEVKKETIVTTAWYTPQIPLSNGPSNYQGLPGLILEINDGKKIIVCTEIILNPKEKITIQEPKKGKVVSQKKFNKIRKEKTDEMMEKMKGRNGLDLGNGVNIKFGG